MCGGPDKPKATAEEKMLSRIAAGEWQIHKDFFRPMENKYIQNVTAQNRDEYKGDVVQAAGAGIQTSNAEATGAGLRMSAVNGVDPEGSRFDSTSKALQKAAALNTGRTTIGAMIDAETAAQGGRMNIVSIGQGKSATAQQGFRQMAGNAFMDEQRDAVNEFRQSNNNLNAAVSAGAMAAPYMMNGNATPPANAFDTNAVQPGYGASGYSDGFMS